MLAENSLLLNEEVIASNTSYKQGGGFAWEVFVNEGAREWSTLTLSQPLVHVPRRLTVNVCTKHATAKLSAPTLLVGVELWQEGATHVFTLAESGFTERLAARVASGAIGRQDSENSEQKTNAQDE